MALMSPRSFFSKIIVNKRKKKGNQAAKRGSIGKNTTRQSLARYVSEQNWSSMREMLTDNSCEDEVKRSLLKVDILGQTVLHQVCRMHPPLDVVEGLIGLCPSLIRHLDYLERTPLHHAVGWGASPQVIDYLLSKHEEAASKVDKNGKTPLHLAFDGSSDGWVDTGNEAGDIVVGSLISVIETLCRAAPGSINISDKDEKSPLEYAILHGFNFKVIHMLQRESVSDWRRQAGDLRGNVGFSNILERKAK